MATDDPVDPGLGEAIARLRDQLPDQDLWPHIARQLEPRRPRGTLLIRWPTALAAGLALVLASSAGTGMLLRRAHTADSVATAAPAPAPSIAASYAPGDAALARSANDLEKVVRSTLPHVDPQARTAIDQALTLLDSAIAQATARQQAAPDDQRAARFLTSTLRKKLQLLRTVSELTRHQS